MFDKDTAFKEMALELDVGTWMIDFGNESIYWPKGLGLDKVKKTYGWTPLTAVADLYEESERRRFFAFVEDLLQHPNQDRIIRVTARGPAEARIPLRLCGRAVRSEKETVVFGLIEALPGKSEGDDLAKTLSAVLDGVFLASDAGTVVFDEMIRIRRMNPAAIRILAGGGGGDATGARLFALAEERLPASLTAALAECLEKRAAVGGQVEFDAGGPRYGWRANPYGIGGGGRGVVLVLNPPAPAARGGAKAATPARMFQILDYVQHPTVVVASDSAEIRFANRPARQMLKLADDQRYRVRNLAELSGQHLARATGGEFRLDVLPVTLPMGARITRAAEIDQDLLLVEYVYK